MLLSDLVHTSNRLAETSRRLDRIERLARCLREFDGREIQIGIAYLAGDLPQGRMGIGPAVLARAECEPAPAATLAQPAEDVAEALSQAVPAALVTPRTVTQDPGEAQAFLQEAVRAVLEGRGKSAG